jgi:tRNA-binding protein
VGRKVIVCCNLGPREMGPYVSEALVLGIPHPDSPEDKDQAIPLVPPYRTVFSGLSKRLRGC